MSGNNVQIRFITNCQRKHFAWTNAKKKIIDDEINEIKHIMFSTLHTEMKIHKNT